MYIICIPQPYPLDVTESYTLDLNLNFSELTVAIKH